MRSTLFSIILTPVLLAVVAWPVSADPVPLDPAPVDPVLWERSTAPVVLSTSGLALPAARSIVVPRSPAPELGGLAVSPAPMLPSFGFTKAPRRLGQVTSIAPRIVMPRAVFPDRFQGFGAAAARPPQRFKLTRPAPALPAAANATSDVVLPVDARTTRYVILDEQDEGLEPPRCDGYNPCNADNNPAALAQRDCCAPVTSCDPCAPRRYVVRRVVRPACYRPCYVRPYVRPYIRPYWGWGGGYGWGRGWGWGGGWGHRWGWGGGWGWGGRW